MDVPALNGQGREGQSETTINIIGERSFAFNGDAHRVVTFLNQTLKYRDLIFGVSQNTDGTFKLRIYEVNGEK